MHRGFFFDDFSLEKIVNIYRWFYIEMKWGTVFNSPKLRHFGVEQILTDCICEGWRHIDWNFSSFLFKLRAAIRRLASHKRDKWKIYRKITLLLFCLVMYFMAPAFEIIWMIHKWYRLGPSRDDLNLNEIFC